MQEKGKLKNGNPFIHLVFSELKLNFSG